MVTASAQVAAMAWDRWPRNFRKLWVQPKKKRGELQMYLSNDKEEPGRLGGVQRSATGFLNLSITDIWGQMGSLGEGVLSCALRDV